MLFGFNKTSKLFKIFRFFLILFLFGAWIFSGWPQIFNLIPPRIKEVKSNTTNLVVTSCDVNNVTNTECYNAISADGGTSYAITKNIHIDAPFQTLSGVQSVNSATLYYDSWGTLSGTWAIAIKDSRDGTVICSIDPAPENSSETTNSLDCSSITPTQLSNGVWLFVDNNDDKGPEDINLDYFRLYIDYTPPPSTFNQSAYRLFNNADSTDVGTPLAVQDTSATLSSDGDAFRLRLLIHIGSAQLALNGETFKLQFAQKSGTCDTSFSGETYTDVTTSTAIAYYDNSSPADGVALTSNANDPVHGTDNTVNQTYEESNNFTNSQAAIPSGEDGMWDFALYDNTAPDNTSYCFRVVKSDDSLLDTYTVIPEITTAGATINLTITETTINLGSVNAGTRVTATTQIKIDTNSANGYEVSVGRDRSNPAHTLASEADPQNVYISDTAGGINVFDGLTTCNAPAVWVSGSSTGLGFTLYESDIDKDTSCWGTGITETDANNKYAALQASASASAFLDTTSNTPNPSYASVGWSLDVSPIQRATDYTGQVVFTATVNP